jgi:predicted peptidase
MKNLLKFIVIIFVLISCRTSKRIVCDADEDCFYSPVGTSKSKARFPALIILNCGGATAKDLDSILYIADSLHMIFATCHESKNGREILWNDRDIMYVYDKLMADYPVDSARVYIYGFSGQAVQALFELFRNPRELRGVIAACAHRAAMPMANWDELAGKSIFLISREKDWNLGDNRYMHNQFKFNGIQDTLVITPGEHSPATRRELYDACFWLLHKND